MPFKEKDILDVIFDLSHSTGSYGRLYRDLMELKEADPDSYAKLMQKWEAEEFEKPLDLILFLEEGKHCKKKETPKHAYNLVITTTFVKNVKYETNAPTIEEAIEEAFADVDLLNDALIDANIDTIIKPEKKRRAK